MRYWVSLLGLLSLAAGCAGVNVVNPRDQNKNAGALAVDWSGGAPKLVATYTCTLDSMGKRYSGMGKTEEDARNDAVARCHDGAVLSFCKPEKATCVKN